MKNFLVIGFIALSQYCFSQNSNTKQNEKVNYYSNYQTALSKQNPNYFDIHKTFNQYWESLDEEKKARNARELKLFKRWDLFWGPRIQGTDGNMNKFLASYGKSISHDKPESLISNHTPCPRWIGITTLDWTMR